MRRCAWLALTAACVAFSDRRARSARIAAYTPKPDPKAIKASKKNSALKLIGLCLFGYCAGNGWCDFFYASPDGVATYAKLND